MARRREPDRDEDAERGELVDAWRFAARYHARMHGLLPRSEREYLNSNLSELTDDELRVLAEAAPDNPGSADVLRCLDRVTEELAEGTDHTNEGETT